MQVLPCKFPKENLPEGLFLNRERNYVFFLSGRRGSQKSYRSQVSPDLPEVVSSSSLHLYSPFGHCHVHNKLVLTNAP